MEDIYSNLDNYEEERNLEQLQKENDVLREKLDVINYSLSRLQADHDNLKKEHEKMQSNYSSLLKTAKAEIERKTHLITTLNNEKDQLILKFLSEPTNRYNNRKVTYVKDKILKQKDNKNMNELLDHKKGNVTEMSCEEEYLRTTMDKQSKQKTRNSSSSHRSQSEENCCHKVESNDTLNKNKHWKKDEEKMGERNVETKKVEECKENVHNDDSTKTNDSIYKANLVTSRRKSVSKHLLTSQLNSEDESGDDYPKRSSIKSHLDDHHQFERSNSRKGKYSNYTDSNDVPKRNKYDSKNITNKRRDYETNKRMFRSRAPDREWKESRFHKTEHDQRYLESSHDTVKQKRRDHRPEYYSDRYKNSYREQKSFKHKLNESEESVKCKKPRTENTNTEYIDTNKEKGPTEVNIDITEIEACVLEENFIDNYIKKPKDMDTTALTAMQYEDPRLTSKKYMKVLDSKNNVSICTVTETNIDLKYIQYDNVISPSKNSVSECFIKEIYNNIDNEIREMSVESGEIIEYNQEANDNNIEDNFNEVHIQNNISLTSLSDKEMEPYSELNLKQDISTKCVANGKPKYRIPKIKDIKVTEYNNDSSNVSLTENNSSILSNCLERLQNTTEEKVPTDKFHLPNIPLLKDPTALLQPNVVDNNPDFSCYKHTKVISLNLDITDENKAESILRDSVVDDLALSDDNSDYNEQSYNLRPIEPNNFVDVSAKSHNSSQISNSESTESNKNILTAVSGSDKCPKGSISTLPALSTENSLITPEDLDLPLKQTEPIPAILFDKNIPYLQHLDAIEELEHLKKTQNVSTEKIKGKEFYVIDKLNNRQQQNNIKENEDEINYTAASTTRLSTSSNINYSSESQSVGESTPALVSHSYTNKDFSPANCSTTPKPNENNSSSNVLPTSVNPPPDIRIVVKRRRTVCRKRTSTGQ